MRAISQEVLGGPEVLSLVDAAMPTLGPTDILVRVHAAGVNPTDWLHRKTGLYLGEPPFVVGWDVSGVVEAVGVGVTVRKPGDEVFGMLDYPRGAGAYAEYVAAPARNFVPKPAAVDHVHAAALPIVALTAWQALVDTADVRPGQRVLVHAAAGGVGHVAVQIAKARGAHVIGTASAGKHDFVLGLGADEVIDYTTTDFAETVRDVDVVFDTVGGDYAPRSMRTMRPGGVLIAIVFSQRERVRSLAKEHGVRVEHLTVEADHAGMSAIADLVQKGLLRVEVEDVLPLEKVAEAHRRGEAGHTTGKLVLTVAD